MEKMDIKKIEYHTNKYLEKKDIVREGDKIFTFIKFGNYRRHKVEIVKDEDKDQRLKEIYDNKSTTRNGRDSFYNKVREKYGNITREYAFNWLRKQENYQLHLIQRRESVLKPIAYDRINKMWMIDLIDMSSYSGPQNRNKKWILTCIDVFSKYAWAAPMPNKGAFTCRQALEKILDEGWLMTGSYPTLVQSDNGGEFVNANFELLFETFDIAHVRAPSYMPQAQACVERFNRTLKNLIFSNMTRNDNKKWVDDLPILLKNYNNSIHSTIKAKPIDIHKNGKKNAKQIKLIAKKKDELLKSNISYPELKIGDKVRIHILTQSDERKKKFAKKYLPQWSEDIYKVKYIVGDKSSKVKPKYKIVDGREVVGTYYRHDLQLIL